MASGIYIYMYLHMHTSIYTYTPSGFQPGSQADATGGHQCLGSMEVSEVFFENFK
jgi:hypothetical protein